jgi:hypothetical protein
MGLPNNGLLAVLNLGKGLFFLILEWTSEHAPDL